jgi:hypothetical protein
VLLVGSHGIELRLDNPGDSVSQHHRGSSASTLLRQGAPMGSPTPSTRSRNEETGRLRAAHSRLASGRNSRIAHLRLARGRRLPRARQPHASAVLENVLGVLGAIHHEGAGSQVEAPARLPPGNATAVSYCARGRRRRTRGCLRRPPARMTRPPRRPRVDTHLNFRVRGPIDVAQAITLLADLREGRCPRAVARQLIHSGGVLDSVICPTVGRLEASFANCNRWHRSHDLPRVARGRHG